MGDMGDDYRAWREASRNYRRDNARPCPRCQELLPKAHPAMLLPGQRCKIHGYRDPREQLPQNCSESK